MRRYLHTAYAWHSPPPWRREPRRYWTTCCTSDGLISQTCTTIGSRIDSCLESCLGSCLEMTGDCSERDYPHRPFLFREPHYSSLVRRVHVHQCVFQQFHSRLHIHQPPIISSIDSLYAITSYTSPHLAFPILTSPSWPSASSDTSRVLCRALHNQMPARENAMLWPNTNRHVLELDS